MAKRKGTKTAGVKRAKPKPGTPASARKRSAAKSARTRKTASATSARKTGAKRPKVARRRPTVAVARKKTSPARTAAKRTPTRKVAAPKAAAPKAALRSAAKPSVAKPRRASAAPPRKAPALNRDRRIVRDDDVVPTPPSTLDFDRSASSARTGRRELRERFDEHTETGPTLTGGDVDADWESAYSVGDEAPGGDNPTPDQDIVDDIGRAVGVEYQDNEELKGDEKIASRDRHRWELDPASAEDYDEH